LKWRSFRGVKLLSQIGSWRSLEIQRVLEEEGIYVITDVKVKKVKRGESDKLVITNMGDIEAD